MKIAICSDLHLEVGSINLANTENAKVLLLCGDICVGRDVSAHGNYLANYHSEMIHEFFIDCGLAFEYVIYIVGNHEHYRGDFATTVTKLKEKFAYIPNLHILDKETLVIDDITFIGGTLWTDMNNSDPETIKYITRAMNDFIVVQNSTPSADESTKFTPQDAIEEHQLMLAYIQSVVDADKDAKYIVVGHHSPSFQSLSVEYQNDTKMNGGYHSNLDQFVIDHPQIKLWAHGHTHSIHDYILGNTRIFCNPRGYIRYEARADNFELQFIEVI